MISSNIDRLLRKNWCNSWSWPR